MTKEQKSRKSVSLLRLFKAANIFIAKRPRKTAEYDMNLIGQFLKFFSSIKDTDLLT